MLNNLNYCRRYHQNGSNRFKKNKSRRNRGKRYSYNEEDKAGGRENVHLLEIATKNLACLIKIFESKAVNMPDEEKMFREMVEFLKSLRYGEKPLKINYGKRHGSNLYKSWQPLNLDGDEEIVASAIISANKSRTTIISDDSDIKRILAVALRDRKFYEKFWRVFPRNQIRLFSDYKKTGNYSLEYDSDFPHL